jgi:hypothetical protein
MDAATDSTTTKRLTSHPSLDFEAGRIYADYLESRMADELKVMDSLTQRGIAVITTAGALVTLLLAAGSLAIGTDIGATDLRVWTKVLAGLAVIGFVFAAGLGLAVNRTTPEDPPDATSIKNLDEPSGDQIKAVAWVIRQRRCTLEDWYPKNTTKAHRLRSALTLEAVAVALLGGAILTAILGV